MWVYFDLDLTVRVVLIASVAAWGLMEFALAMHHWSGGCEEKSEGER